MRNINTNFPTNVDDRMFISDMDISNQNVMNAYKNYISKGNYSKASELLNDSETFFYGAWLLNLFECRLEAVGKYLLNLDNNNFTVYQAEEPENLEIGYQWIGD